MTTQSPPPPSLTRDMLGLIYLGAGLIALLRAIFYIITLWFLPIGLAALVVALFWLGAGRRIASGGGPTRLGSVFAALTVFVALILARSIAIASTPRPSYGYRVVYGYYVPTISVWWLVVPGFVALSVLPYLLLVPTEREPGERRRDAS